MMSTEFREAQKFVTQLRREQKRHREAVERENTNHEARVAELRKELTPAAERLVAVVLEQESAPDQTAAPASEPPELELPPAAAGGRKR